MKQMNGLDRMFLNVESSRLPMDLVGILLLDPSTAPDDSHGYERVRAELAARLPRMNIFASRPVAAPWGVGHEHWVLDPDFDIDHHVKHVGVPAPYDVSALCHLVASLFDEPLDRNRPLWQVYYVDGFADGAAALLLRIHHASVDGVGGTQMLKELFDAKPLPSAVTQDRVVGAGERVPSSAEMLIRALPEQIATPARLLQHGVPVFMPLARRMTSRLARSIVPSSSQDPAEPKSLATGPVPRMLFNRATPSGKRAVAAVSVPMADVRRVKEVYGGTINDVVLTITHAAVCDYLRERGELPKEPLRVVGPVNVRDETDDAGSGNHFAFMSVPIPSDIDDPVDRLKTVSGLAANARPKRASTKDKKTKKLTNSGVSQAMRLVDTLPTGTWQIVRELVRSGLAGAVPPLTNYVVSNIPGPIEKLYLAGAEVTHIYGRTMVGAGVGLFIFCISYGETLEFGITALADLVPDPDVIASGISEQLDRLLESV